jgi:hypothetical protein
MSEPEVRLHDVSVSGADHAEIVAAVERAAAGAADADRSTLAEAVRYAVTEAVARSAQGGSVR